MGKDRMQYRSLLLCDLTKSLIEQENDIYYLITFDMTELYYHWRKQLGSPIVSLEKKPLEY